METPGGREITPRSAKARGLLAYLALAPAGTAPRAKVAALLWGDSPIAMASLRQAVKEIRTGFAAAGVDVFAADHHDLHLDLERLWVDVLRLDDLVATFEAEGPVRPVWTRGLLEDETIRAGGFEDWLVVEQARCRQQIARALAGRIERAVRQGRHEDARRHAEALVILDPVDEEAYRTLMRCAARAGDVAGAIRSYETCRAALARDLDIAPSPETEHLLRDIRHESAKPHPRPAGLSAVVSRRMRTRAMLAIEPAGSILGKSADQPVAHILAVSLQDVLARHRWLALVDTDIRLHGAGAGGGARPFVQAEIDYLVLVSAFRVGERIRLIVELKDARSRQILWATRLDHTPDQDLLLEIDGHAGRLAIQLEQEVRQREIEKARRTPIEVSSAYELVMRAIPLIFRMTRESFTEAEGLLRLAEQADPDDPLVYTWRAFQLFLSKGQGWIEDDASLQAELGFCTRRALELDPSDALANTIAGHVASFVFHDYGEALSYFDRAFRAGGNPAYTLGFSAITLNYLGRPDQALDRLRHYRNLAPFDPYHFFFRTTASITHLLAGEFERAAELGRRTVREHPAFQAGYRPLIASLGHLGRVDEARVHREALGPEFTIDWFRKNYPPLRQDQSTLYIEGLRKAGVPES